MAEENKKPLTAAEQAEEAKKDQELHKKTLLSILISEGLGAADTLNIHSYGPKGDESAKRVYHEAMASPEATELKNKIYKETLKTYEDEGVYGSPATPSEGDIERSARAQREVAFAKVTLGSLEEILGKKGVKHAVPEKFKEYTFEKLYLKGTDNEEGERLKKIDESKFNEEEKAAYDMYHILHEDYMSKCSWDAVAKYQSTYSDERWKAVREKYASPEEKAADKAAAEKAKAEKEKGAKPADKKK